MNTAERLTLARAHRQPIAWFGDDVLAAWAWHTANRTPWPDGPRCRRCRGDLERRLDVRWACPFCRPDRGAKKPWVAQANRERAGKGRGKRRKTRTTHAGT